MQTSLTYRTNRGLFSNYYLEEHLPETEEWNEIDGDELRGARSEIVELWDDIRADLHPYERNESKLEDDFIRPMFRLLGIPYVVEEKVHRSQRRPDYGFFESEGAIHRAYERSEEGADLYKDAIAVADAKRWGRPLDTRGSGEHQRDFENPSYQIHVYLGEVDDAQWGVLTNGQKWRLYYGPTSYRLDSYYEVDLPTILEKGDPEDFKYFYLFFRHEAFLEDSSGDGFLDDVYAESNIFAQELGEDLQDNILKAIEVLSNGFLQYSDNDLDEDDLDLIHDSSLIYLYRVIFVLYAEAESRELLDTSNEIYEQSYSLNYLKQDIADELDSLYPKYRNWQTKLWDRLDELFKLIDQGSKSRGIPKQDLYIPAYNGGLFRTEPEDDDSVEARFLANVHVGDEYLAKVIELLTRSQNGNGGEKIFVDYSSLDVRHLGTIYEGLLENKLKIADEPKSLDDGEYVSADEGDKIVVQEGDVYLKTGSGERKATGSYYTPEYIVEYIVEKTLGPLVDDIRGSFVGHSAFGEGGFAKEFAEKVLDLKILDPAMGSGHFLTSAIDYLAREIIDAQERQAAQQGINSVEQEHDINWARRQVAQRCIYGVDKNPLAVELAKVSIWLRTLAAEQPLAFLDHRLKTGNSLVGSDIDTMLDNGNLGIGSEEGQLTLQQSFDRTRQQALEHVTDQFEELLTIDNETLDDIKKMEAVYEEVRKNPLYQHLSSMANVHTAEQLDLDVPDDAYKRMAEALRDGSWSDIEEQDWYDSAQKMAEDDRFFHWELEFPIAFYQQDGERKENEGFDAVIGNPPYVQLSMQDEVPEALIDYLKERYKSSMGRANTFGFFTKLSIDVSNNGGNTGIILPNTVLTSSYYEDLRKMIMRDSRIDSILHIGEGPFDDAIVENTVLILERTIETGEVTINSIGNTGIEFSHRIDQNAFSTFYESKFNVNVQSLELSIKESMETHSSTLSELASINQGIALKHNRDKWVYDERKGEDFKPLLEGRDISRYHIREGSKFLKYSSEAIHSGGRKAVYESDEKILFRRTGTEIIACRDDNNHYALNTLVAINIESKIEEMALLALLNSNALNWYFRTFMKSDKNVFSEIQANQLGQVPIPEIDPQHINDTELNILELVNTRESSASKREALNLNLLDYLGISSDELPESKAGEILEDVQMPVAGVADTLLVETTDKYDGLRVERVSFENDGARLLLLVDISYKIDEDDYRKTDRWNRLEESEFETYEAMAFVGLSEAEETLLREFAPVAVDKAGGFAGFRRNASKTISPLDRLKGLTLPNIDEVQTGLQQYIEVKERADQLEEKIENTDQLINEIVYDLYGLTDEEIEIIESAVTDD